MAGWRAAWRFAWRDLRGGLQNFRLFLTALTIGVAGVAAIGSLVAAIQAGLDGRASELLGGDIEIELVYRFAEPEERAAMDAAGSVSETADLRGMARFSDEAAVVQLKAVDAAYPLYGEVELDQPGLLAELLAPNGEGLMGAVAEPALLTRLGIEVGDVITVGRAEFQVRAQLLKEPDRVVTGLSFGPRLMLPIEAIEAAGLAQPGTLFETEYRVRLPEAVDVGVARAELEAAFPSAGWRLTDRRNGAPGVSNVVNQIGSFLTLVGLAALAVGGVGVGASVRAYLDKKTESIATLKTLGAERAMIMRVYLSQIALLTFLGVSVGALIGGALTYALAPLLAETLPVPTEFGFFVTPLIEAAIYGALVAFLFALWPLARATEIRAAGLFRDLVSPTRAWPRPGYLAVMIFLIAALALAAVAFSSRANLALGFVFGVGAAMLALAGAAWLIGWTSRALARSRVGRSGPALRLALASIGGSPGETRSSVLALGLGLTALTALGLVDVNLRNFVNEQLPQRAPTYFVVDIQDADLDRFKDEVGGYAGVERVESAPMLRGVITAINGVGAKEWRESGRVAEGGEWMLRGDRGVTYAEDLEGEIVAGEWWPADYSGEPLVSFGAEQGAELGLSLGDEITVNVLGRDITARVASFRTVEFRTGGINFLMVFSPNTLRGAPHAHIATIYGDEPTPGAYLRDIAKEFPASTAIETKLQLERVASAVSEIANAARMGGLITLITGLVVLAGAAAAGQQARIYEASIMKTLGATRASLLRALTLRAGLLGLSASLVALGAGCVAAWAVTVFALESPFTLDFGVAAIIVSAGLGVTLLSGAIFAYGPLSARPARVLRARE